MLVGLAMGLMMLGTQGCAGSSTAGNTGAGNGSAGWWYGNPDGDVVLDRFVHAEQLLIYQGDWYLPGCSRSRTARMAECELPAGRSATNRRPVSRGAAA